MDAYISHELDRRYAEYEADPNNARCKAVVDLILQAQTAPDFEIKPEKLDPDFKAFAIRQIRLFVFAGHDSMSSTICYLFHLLSKNPKALKDIREEHDQLFGKDVDGASDILKTQPHLANDLSGVRLDARLVPGARNAVTRPVYSVELERPRPNEHEKAGDPENSR